MHGHPKHARTEAPERPAGGASAAVAWIDAHHAVVARTDEAGSSRVEIDADALGGTVPYLARVVDEIGDRERVVILGPDAMRVELEREYVAINHRPERLLDVELAEPGDDLALTSRLVDLADG